MYRQIHTHRGNRYFEGSSNGEGYIGNEIPVLRGSKLNGKVVSTLNEVSRDLRTRRGDDRNSRRVATTRLLLRRNGKLEGDTIFSASQRLSQSVLKRERV